MSKFVRIALFLIFAALALFAGAGYINHQVSTHAVATVQPSQQAVLLRNGDIAEVLGPGLHRYDATRHVVVIYETFWNHTYEMPDPIPVAGCPANVSINYNVGDVAAFHDSGANFDAGASFGAEVEDLASAFSEFGDDPRTEMQVHLRTQLQGTLIDGLAMTALFVDLAGCDPASD